MKTAWHELLHSFEGMFSDSYGDVKLYSTEVVRTRTAHHCPGYWAEAGHAIAPGTTAVREKALVDGKWATCYTCEACIHAWNGECKPARGEA